MTARGRGWWSIVSLLAVNGIATTGMRVSAIAIPWFILSTTGSATQTGLVVAFELTPYVLAKALAGPLIDRLGQRRVAMTADVLSAAAIGAIPLAHSLGGLSIGMLLTFVALAGAVRGPGDNAKHTMVPWWPSGPTFLSNESPGPSAQSNGVRVSSARLSPPCSSPRSDLPPPSA